jgi:molybdate transport system substrate-binding protein
MTGRCSLLRPIVQTWYTRNMICRRFLSGLLLLPALLLISCNSSKPPALTLSVAASLTDTMTALEAAYKQDNPNVSFHNNYGGSGTLALQIQQGAPVDIFFSAASKPMDDLDTKGLLLPGMRRDLLRNDIVLIAPKDSKLKDFDGLVDSQVKRIALGDPASVPAGQYGQQTLTALKLYDRVKSKLVFGNDVRQVLSYVETGNAEAGIVYATDARSSDKVRVLATAPANTHAAIVYPVSVVKASKQQMAATSFLDFLQTPPARLIFEQHGFTVNGR